MLFKQQLADIKMDGDVITITSKEMNASFNYSSINTLYINIEMDEHCREMEVSHIKVKRSEPELADQLRIKLTANGVSLSFSTSRALGELLAIRVEDEFRKMMLENDTFKGGLMDDFQKKLKAENPKEISYPVYFHGCGGFGDDDIDEEDTATEV